MKFLCPNCKAKYQIADEKVFGRAMKMTCRQCSEPIVIRGEGVPRPGAESLRPSGPSAELSAGFQQRLSAPPSRSVPSRALEQWHVSINDTPVGPMGREEVARKIRMGAVGPESLAWREGLDDWLPIAQIPELQALFRSTSTSNLRAPALPIPSATSTRPGSSLSPGQRAAVSSLGGRVPAPHSDMFEPSLEAAAGTRLRGEPFDPSVRPRMHSQSIAPRSTSSSALQAPPPAKHPQPRMPQPAAAAPIAYAPAAEDAQAAATAPAPQAFDRDFGAGQRQGPGWGQMFMLVCGGAFILAVGAFLGARVFAPAPAPAPAAVAAATPTTALPSPAPEPNVAKPTLELALPDDEPAPEPQPVADQAAGAKAGTEAVARRVTPKKVEAPAEKGKTLTAAQRDMLARMGGGEGTSNLAAIKGSSASSNDTSGGAGGEGLDAQQLASVVNKGKRSLQRCYEVALRGSGSTETVRLDVEITVAPSGIVSSVKAKGQSLPGMDQCIHNTVRTWVFPKSGSATTTQFPILFQPGA